MRICILFAVFVFACAAPAAMVAAAPAPAAADSSGAPVGPRYNVQIRNDKDSPWKDDGVWTLGGRAKERPIEIRVGSGDGNKGKDVVGQVKYAQKEGMLGVNLRRKDDRHYRSETWKGNADKVAEAQWVIGREGANVKQLEAKSTDEGETLTGKLTYFGQEPVEFKATLAENKDADAAPGDKSKPAETAAAKTDMGAFDGGYDGEFQGAKIRLVIEEKGTKVVMFAHGAESDAVTGKLTSIAGDKFEGVIEAGGKQEKLTGQRIEKGHLRVHDGDDTFNLTPGINGDYVTPDKAVRFTVSLDAMHFTLEQGGKTVHGKLSPLADGKFKAEPDDQSTLTGERTADGISITHNGKAMKLKPEPAAAAKK